MNHELTIVNKRQSKNLEAIIFEATIDKSLYVHILNLEHLCDTREFNGLIKNEHPIIKSLKVSSNVMTEILALNAFLKTRKRELHLFCPACGIATTHN